MGRDEFKNLIQSRLFSADWDRLGLDDSDLVRLESAILEDPTAGAVIQGTGGVRKTRFARRGSGKSGGFRVFYCYFPAYRVCYCVRLLAKGESENIRPTEKAALRAMISEVETYLKEAHKR
jgi:hypothetical protein